MDGAVVVLDNGSGFLKAGLHTDKEPAVVVPQLIGRPRHRRADIDALETFIGRRAASMSGVCTLSSPSERGLVVNFDDQSLIFEDVLVNQLEVDPCEHAVLLSQLPVSCRHQEKHLTAEFFERFCVPALAKKADCVMTLMGAGLLTGTVVDCGDSVCHTSAVYCGDILLNTAKMLWLGGKDVSERLSRIVAQETGFRATSKSALDHISRIKEGLQGLKEKMLKKKKSLLRRGASLSYILPDGQKIRIKRESVPELYKAGEVLFDPSFAGSVSEGLSEMLIATLANAPSVLYKPLTQNVVLVGGTALLSGLKERLESEVMEHLRIRLGFHIPHDPQLSVWRGGVVLSSLSTFDAMCVTKEAYFEEGPYRIERKFF